MAQRQELRRAGRSILGCALNRCSVVARSRGLSISKADDSGYEHCQHQQRPAHQSAHNSSPAWSMKRNAGAGKSHSKSSAFRFKTLVYVDSISCKIGGGSVTAAAEANKPNRSPWPTDIDH